MYGLLSIEEKYVLSEFFYFYASLVLSKILIRRSLKSIHHSYLKGSKLIKYILNVVIKIWESLIGVKEIDTTCSIIR